MSSNDLSPAKRKVLEQLKRWGPSSVRRIAGSLSTTDVAVRQHLATLQEAGLVQSQRRAPTGRGRPSVQWSLTPEASRLFPDHHAELAVGLIKAIRASEGEAGLIRIAEVRARDQTERYRQLLPASASLSRRVAALAEQRTAEGYMAEVVREGRGRYLLIEHHCPICEAARACSGICRGELEVFRTVLGPDVEVTRTTHLLSGGDRCVYRITSARSGSPPRE
ncbi:MAG: helix-turn-helix transcriptional regulator [Planctomycetota bacterium]|jgi:predicted ArsR family transcriptional regulator